MSIRKCSLSEPMSVAEDEEMWKNRTVKFKILIYNICIICVIGTIFSISSYVTAYQKALLLAQNSVNYHVESLASYYQEVYDKMVNLVLNCSEREVFDLQLLGDLSTIEQKKQGLEYVKLANHFCVMTGYDQYISKLSIFDESDIHISTGSAYSSAADGRRIKHAPWFETELEKDIAMYRLDLVKSPFYPEDEMVLPIVCRNSGYEKTDWTALFLSTSLYQDKLKKDDIGNCVLVATHAGERIASIGEEEGAAEIYDELVRQYLKEEAESGLKMQAVNGRKCMVSWNRDFISGILVVEIMETSVLKSDSKMILQTVLLIFLACAGLGVTLSLLFSSAVRKPIERLLRHVDKIAEGDFTPDETLESGDEIGQIGKAINSMGHQIESLMEKRLEDEKEKSSLELKMLQAQINPHFLYNTLDSIKWIAMIQKNSGIVKTVTALSKLLKNMSKGVDAHITLRQELEFVNDYVTIEKLKYAEMFDLQVDVEDEELYEAKIVKLTLQPLVENAIFSGIEPGGKSGTIQIRAYSREDCLYVAVRDDGIGIPEEIIPQLLDHTEKLKGDRMSSIGMPNVDRRLKLIYGEEYGLSVESEMGVYTQVTVKIPLRY